MNLSQLEEALQQITELPPWGLKQADSWDKHSRLIFNCPTYELLQKELKRINPSEALRHYIINRWYNALSAQGIELILSECKGVIPHHNKYEKEIDFYLHKIPFDHKTTVFPKGFHQGFNHALNHPESLVLWLYNNQSKEGRYHRGNRLFIVLHQSDGKHWQLKKELSFIAPIIKDYIKRFNPDKLIKLQLSSTHTALTYIIWVTR